MHYNDICTDERIWTEFINGRPARWISSTYPMKIFIQSVGVCQYSQERGWPTNKNFFQPRLECLPQAIDEQWVRLDGSLFIVIVNDQQVFCKAGIFKCCEPKNRYQIQFITFSSHFYNNVMRYKDHNFAQKDRSGNITNFVT